MKKFSIPFNGINPDLYLELLNPYKEHIDHIYLGISSLLRNHDDYKIMEHKAIIKENGEHLKKDEYEENAFQLLLKAQGKYKTILTLNSGHYIMPPNEIYGWCDNVLFPFVEVTKIAGCICTNFDMAKYIHEHMPHLELHTSCNCFQWNIKQMEHWQKHCGITVFNPPREILRSPRLLKEMHDAGFIIKALINESCLYGCPQTVNHAMTNAVGSGLGSECSQGDPANFFRSNWVLPRWLDQLDEYVDIYKINGRTAINYRYIFEALDAYTKRKEVDDITKIILGGTCNFKFKAIVNPIPSKKIPDKLLTCECRDCNKTCFVCENLMKEFKK